MLVTQDHVVEVKLQMTVSEMKELLARLSDERFHSAGSRLHAVLRGALEAAGKHFNAEHPITP